MLKMYVVVRNDLEPAQQIVQTGHALADFAVKHQLEFARWQRGNNTLVVLQVPNGYALDDICTKARDAHIVCTKFREPNLLLIGRGRTAHERCNQYTALAIEPNWLAQNVILKGLPLANPAPKKRGWFG